MLSQGLVLLVAGMVIVMAFLLFLIIVMNLLAKIAPSINHILPDPQPKAVKKPAATVSDDTAVAIAIAVARSRG